MPAAAGETSGAKPRRPDASGWALARAAPAFAAATQAAEGAAGSADAGEQTPDAAPQAARAIDLTSRGIVLTVPSAVQTQDATVQTQDATAQTQEAAAEHPIAPSACRMRRQHVGGPRQQLADPIDDLLDPPARRAARRLRTSDGSIERPFDAVACPGDPMERPIDAVACLEDPIEHPIDAVERLEDPIGCWSAPPTCLRRRQHLRGARRCCVGTRGGSPSATAGVLERSIWMLGDAAHCLDGSTRCLDDAAARRSLPQHVDRSRSTSIAPAARRSLPAARCSPLGAPR
jgi:hypothetical protein